MHIGIVTDSTSDLPKGLAEKFNIGIIPSLLILNDKQYLDGEGITREEFYGKLNEYNPPPTTAAPSSGMFGDLYRQFFDQGYDHILSIHITPKLSGIYNAAKLAAEGFKGRVTVIDSTHLSMGLGFQALTAAEMAAEGKDKSSILSALEAVRRRTKLVAMLDTFEQLRRSGRVSWARAGLGTLLRIKPFVEVVDGEVLRLGEARTRRKGIARFTQMLRDLGPLERLAMLHTNAEGDARSVYENLNPDLPTQPFFRNVTTVIGTHVGVNGLGFAAIVRK